jgi:uncharacterized protein
LVSFVVTESITPQFQLGIKPTVAHGLIALEIIFALFAGLGLIAIGAGEGAWILGGIVAGAVVIYLYRSRYQGSIQPNRNARKLGQMLTGLAVGCSVQNNDLTALPSQLPVFLLLTAFLLVSSGAIGYLYSRLERTDLLTALLANVPGNIGIMSSVAADYGRNAALVSLIQLLRFTSVTLIIPIIANISNSRDVGATLNRLIQDSAAIDLNYLGLLSLLMTLTVLAVRLGTKLKVPVANFFCPILVGIIFNLVVGQVLLSPDTSFNLPLIFKVMGQILLGMTIGEFWGISAIPSRLTVAYASIPVGLMLLIGLISAAIAKLTMPWDWLTCLLVTAPGGSPEMIWIALSLNHDVEIVTTGHLVRLLTINLLLPALISLGLYLENRMTKTENLKPALTADELGKP